MKGSKNVVKEINKQDIVNLQQFLSRGAPTSSPEILFHRAKSRFDAERSHKREQYATLLLSAKDGDKPVAGAEISLTDKLGDPLEWNGTRKTTEEGLGLVSLPLSLAQNKPTLQVTLSLNRKMAITVKQLMPSSSDKRKYVMDSYILEAEWLNDQTEFQSTKHNDRIQRFNIAIASDAKNLDETLAFAQRHGCFRLKQVFIEGKQPKDISLPKSVLVAAIGNDIMASLAGIDVLLDFSESKFLNKLWLSQVLGARKIPALIVPARRFLGRIDQLEQAFRPLNTLNNDIGE